MPHRLIWAAIVLAAIAGFYFATIRPAMRGAPVRVPRRELIRDFQPPEIALPPLPRPSLPVSPASSPPPLPALTLGKTAILLPESPASPADMLRGKMQAQEKEALEEALRRMSGSPRKKAPAPDARP